MGWMELRNCQEQDTQYQTTTTSDLLMTTSGGGLASDWAADLAPIIELAEEAERGLSYLSACGSEQARKQAGSYYTPSDVASFFWNEFFEISGIDTPKSAVDFVMEHRFIEPSAGAGALVFSLLNKLAKLGVEPETLGLIDLKIIDINKQSLVFIRDQILWLSAEWNVEFSNIDLICSDFRDVSFADSDRPQFYFGNPPFVKNEKGSSAWKNLFADFSEIALMQAGRTGSVHLILPLSLAFSRDYKKLREMLFEYDRTITLSHFDNIPDTLFKSGKPEHTNTNKANSQRCSILTVQPAEKTSVYSSQLHRWSKYDREEVLSRSPVYHDVSSYNFDDQIPRPENSHILDYLEQAHGKLRLGDMCSRDGRHILYVGSVSRNYISIREDHAPGVHQLRFARKGDFYRALHILSSELFRYRARNHPETLSDEEKTNWQAYRKNKLNSGRCIHSYDFSERMPSLISL